MQDEPRTFRDGARAGLPYAAASGVLALSFGVVATDLGLPALAAVVMSAIVFAGSAQFAAVGILAAGGGVAAAVGAAALMNSRFIPMGFALGPSLRGSRARRALEGQVVVDSSWAMAARGDGRFDRAYLFGHTAVQYVAWVTGTVAGVVAPSMDARALGLDAVFPAFFLALLAGELVDRRRVGVAVRVVVLLGSALLSALVVRNALADGGRLHVGADTAGVLVAGVLVWRRVHVVVAVLAAAGVNAGRRGATRWATGL